MRGWRRRGTPMPQLRRRRASRRSGLKLRGECLQRCSPSPPPPAGASTVSPAETNAARSRAPAAACCAESSASRATTALQGRWHLCEEEDRFQAQAVTPRRTSYPDLDQEARRSIARVPSQPPRGRESPRQAASRIPPVEDARGGLRGAPRRVPSKENLSYKSTASARPLEPRQSHLVWAAQPQRPAWKSRVQGPP